MALIGCAVLLAAAGALLFVVRDGPDGSGHPATVQVSPEPKTVEAAKAAVQKAMSRAFAGDPAGAYALLSSHGKSLISEADYIRYARACSGATGFVAEVTDIRLETPEKAVAIVQWVGFAMPINAFYEGGAWTWEPAAEFTAGWSKPVEQRVAEGKADGSCVPAPSHS